MKQHSKISVILLGEHDKGTGCAFSPETVSGRRLRKIVADIGLECDFNNVFSYSNGATSNHGLAEICKPYSVVVALGKIAAEECNIQGIQAIYLPHPAVRSQSQLNKLRDGLLTLKDNPAGYVYQ
ncbi:MAG: hypothetical protein ACLQF0_09140 [Dissulfurispiraceae bacterium]